MALNLVGESASAFLRIRLEEVEPTTLPFILFMAIYLSIVCYRRRTNQMPQLALRDATNNFASFAPASGRADVGGCQLCRSGRLGRVGGW